MLGFVFGLMLGFIFCLNLGLVLGIVSVSFGCSLGLGLVLIQYSIQSIALAAPLK